MATKTRVKSTTAAKKPPARTRAAAPRTRGPAKKRPPAAAPVVGPRRAVFIDVENTSSDAALSRVLDDLKIDLMGGATEVVAIGNWRVVGQQLGRSLARRGAHLLHSAPAMRVPDWSDLWIAVQVGIWLGGSRPGDTLEIVSHDRAFDAVGDAAARLGVVFHRITYHAPGANTALAADDRSDEPAGGRRGRRRSRRGRGQRGGRIGATSSGAREATAAARRAPAPPPPVTAAPSEAPRHGASPAQLDELIARLAGADPSRTVTLDALTVALKAAGFQRPPGSPRLVTLLRRMKSIEVLASGKVRLIERPDAAAPLPPDDPLAALAPVPQRDFGENSAHVEGAPTRRSRRRGGRRHGGRRGGPLEG